MKKKILIVDDHADLRRLLRLTLKDEGYELHEVANGPDAVAEAERLQPDLVLLDIMMPGGMDGYRVCRLLKTGPGLMSRTKVIFITARGQPYDRAHATSIGADGYITKPFSPLEVIEQVRQALA